MSDPAFVRNQASLTTSSGRIWLIVGGLFAVIVAGTLFALAQLPPPGFGLVGGIVVVALYLVMVVARLALRGRARLGVMAGAMILMAVIGLGCALVVAWTMA